MYFLLGVQYCYKKQSLVSWVICLLITQEMRHLRHKLERKSESCQHSCVALSYIWVYDFFHLLSLLPVFCSGSFPVLSSSLDCVFILLINWWIIIYYDLLPSNLFLSLFLEYSWKLNLLQMNVDLHCWQQACSYLIRLTEASLLTMINLHCTYLCWQYRTYSIWPTKPWDTMYENWHVVILLYCLAPSLKKIIFKVFYCHNSVDVLDM